MKPSRRPYRRPRPTGKPWAAIAIAALLGAGCLVAYFMGTQARTPASIVREQTEAILAAWKVGKTHSVDRTNDRLFNVRSWNILDVQATPDAGTVIAAVESTNHKGIAIAVSWRFIWKRDRYKGWQAIALQTLNP